MNKLLYVVLLMGGFGVLLGVGRFWKLRPETKYNHILHSGETAVVTSSLDDRVWFASSEKDCYAFNVAMANRDSDYLTAAENNKSAFVVPVGTQVKVLGQAESRVRVEVTEGAATGQHGWVEFEYVRPKRPGEFR